MSYSFSPHRPNVADQRSSVCFTAARETLPLNALPPCPRCGSTSTYQDAAAFVCLECANEWREEAATDRTTAARGTRDAVGNELRDGDSVTVIKDLKVKGSSAVVKVGTKVKHILLVDGDHDIA